MSADEISDRAMANLRVFDKFSLHLSLEECPQSVHRSSLLIIEGHKWLVDSGKLQNCDC